ncbi:MAG: putative secreted protein [Myxococcaceae bacterium]|nr:putative secreted protein [Myxococcaceae bacterium]
MYAVRSLAASILFSSLILSVTPSLVQADDRYAQANAPPRPLDRAPEPQTDHHGQPPVAAPAQLPAAPVVVTPALPEVSEPPPLPDSAAGTPEVAGEPVENTPADAAVPLDPSVHEPTELEINLQTAQEDLQGLRTDVENFKFQWQRERDLHTAITTRFLKINGVVQGRFGWQDEKVNSSTVRKRNTSFDINSAILGFTGTLYKDYEEGRNLTYNLRFGVSKQTNTNNSYLNLLDAQIAYNLLPSINPEDPLVTITLGQQLLPFGLEVPATEELRPVVRNAQFTTPTTLNLTRREVGAIVRGELFPLVDFGYNYRVPVIQYAFGVVDGAGPNTLDNNGHKDIIARLAFTVPSDFNSWLRQITIGGSAYLGRANQTITEMGTTSVVGTGRANRYGLDFYYNHWPFGVTYEYIYSDDQIASGTKANISRRYLKRDSHVATMFLSFGEQFVGGFRNQGRLDDWWPKTYQPFLRYDRFNNDRGSKTKMYSDVYTAGFNLFLAETTKFQFNYNLTNSPYDSTRMVVLRDDKRWTHEVLLQAQYGF